MAADEVTDIGSEVEEEEDDSVYLEEADEPDDDAADDGTGEPADAAVEPASESEGAGEQQETGTSAARYAPPTPAGFTDADKARLTEAINSFDADAILGAIAEVSDRVADQRVQSLMAAQSLVADPLDAAAQRNLYQMARSNPAALGDPNARDMARVAAALEVGQQQGLGVWDALRRVMPIDVRQGVGQTAGAQSVARATTQAPQRTPPAARTGTPTIAPGGSRPKSMRDLDYERTIKRLRDMGLSATEAREMASIKDPGRE